MILKGFCSVIIYLFYIGTCVGENLFRLMIDKCNHSAQWPMFSNWTKKFSQLIRSDVQDEEELSSSEKSRVPAPKRAHGKTKFQLHWLNETDDNGDKLAQYIIPDKDDKFRAICSVCYSSLDISNAGKSSLLIHARTNIHKQRMKLERGPSH